VIAHPDITSIRNYFRLGGENSSNISSMRMNKLPQGTVRNNQMAAVHPQPRKKHPPNLSPEVQMIFKIHSPIQDHRDPGACAFLLTS
jgi:hypothetical protein